MTTGVLHAPGPALTESRPLAIRFGPLAALCGLVSAVVHVLTVDTASAGSVVMATLALVCLTCAWHLWRRPTASVWALTALLDLGMLSGHVAMVLTAPDHTSGHTSHAEHVHWADPAWLVLGLVGASLAMSAAALHEATQAGGRR